jgi:hypothetical protein
MFPHIPKCVDRATRIKDEVDISSPKVLPSITTSSVPVQSNSRPTRFSSVASSIPYAFHSPSSSTLSPIFSQPPEAYFALYPRSADANTTLRPAGGPTEHRGTATFTTLTSTKDTLISRFGLESRLSSAEALTPSEQGAGDCAVWEDTAEKREASLRERKAQMILAARQCVQPPFLLTTI